MIRISLIGLFTCFMLSSGCKTTKETVSTESPLYKVTGSIYVTSDYCGGARPTEEMLDKLKTPKPYVGKKIYIRKGVVNTVDSPILYALVTDDEGKFTAQLPAGNYVIIDEYRINNGFTDSLFANTLQNIRTNDPACIKQWFNDGLAKFKVDKADQTLPQLNIHQQCFRPDGVPCLMYTGELPK